jgi:hypothetical protein
MTNAHVCHGLNILKVKREAENKLLASFLAAAHQCGNSIKAYLFPFKFTQRSRLKSRLFMNISHGSDEAANQPKNKKGIKSTRRLQDLPVHVNIQRSRTETLAILQQMGKRNVNTALLLLCSVKKKLVTV